MRATLAADSATFWREPRSFPSSLLCWTAVIALAVCLPTAVEADGAAPSQLQVTATTQLFVPGQTTLQFRVSLQDAGGETITSDPADPYLVTMTVCRPGSAWCSKLESVQPPTISFLGSGPNAVADGGVELQNCDEATKTMRVFVTVFGGQLPTGQELVDSIDVSCRACLEGEATAYAQPDSAPRLYACISCGAGQYLSPSTRACHTCPAGADCSARGLVGKVNGSVWRVDAGTGTFRLQGCPSGTLLANASHDEQQCVRCAPDTYALDPLEGCDEEARACPLRACHTCPVGATCREGLFAVADGSSAWETVQTMSGRQIKRVTACAPGLVLVRGTDTAQDQCWPCPPGSYSISPAVYPLYHPWSMAVESVEEAKGVCLECDQHARCLGASRVLPRKGFWMMPPDPLPARRAPSRAGHAHPETEASGVSGRRNEEEEEEEEGLISRVELYACPLNACLDGGVCSAGRKGRVCGVCDGEANYVLSGSTCFQCDGSDEKARIWVLLVVALPTILLAWYLAAWQPYFVPAPIVQGPADEAAERAEQRGGSKEEDDRKKQEQEQKSGAVSKWKAWALEWLWRPAVIETVKLFISFWQVASTLETHYSIEWPSELANLWRRMSLFRAGLQSISAINCIASKLPYLTILQIYLITPLFVALGLWVPSLVLILTGNAKFWPFPNTQNRFWTSLLYWQFITYPIMATISMQGFSCRRIGEESWLVADLSVPCPAVELGGVYGWSIFGAVVYPFGIPLLLYGALVRLRVPEIAKLKRQDAILREMLAVYKKVSDRALSTKIAAYIVRESDKKLLTERAEERAEGMFRSLEQDGYTRSIVELSAYLHSQGVAANHEEEIAYLLRHAPRVDPDIAWFEKHKGIEQAALEDLIQRHRPVSGRESLEELDGVAVKELCRFRWHDLLPPAYKPSTDFDKEWDVIPEWLLEQHKAGNAHHRPEWVMRHGEEEMDEEMILEAEAKRPERVQWLVGMGEFLLRHGAIRLPLLKWTGETKAERLAMDRVGFLFKHYQCDLWYYEFIEMARKFMMCAVVLFLHPGSPQQALLGLCFAICFLLAAIANPPYVEWTMNMVQRLCLAILPASLLYGLLLDRRRLQPLEGSADADIFKVLILGAHAFMFVLPILMVLAPTLLAKWNFRHWSHLWKGRSGFSRSVLKRSDAQQAAGTLTRQPSMSGTLLPGMDLTRKSSGMAGLTKQMSGSVRQNSDKDNHPALSKQNSGRNSASRQNSHSFRERKGAGLGEGGGGPHADMVFDSFSRREIAAKAPGVYASPLAGSRSDSGGGVGLVWPGVDVEHGKRLAGSFGRHSNPLLLSRNSSSRTGPRLSRNNSSQRFAAAGGLNDPDRLPWGAVGGFNDPDRVARPSALDPEPPAARRPSDPHSAGSPSSAAGLGRERSAGGSELLQSGMGASRLAMEAQRHLQPAPSVIREESSISSMHDFESKSPHHGSQQASRLASRQGSLHDRDRDAPRDVREHARRLSTQSAISVAASDTTVCAQPLIAVDESALAGGVSLQDRWPPAGLGLTPLPVLRSPKNSQGVAHC